MNAGELTAAHGTAVVQLGLWVLLLSRLWRRDEVPVPADAGAAERAGWFWFAAALAVRAAQGLAFAASPLFAMPICDARFYHEWAVALARGVDPFPVFWVDPLYPYLLGGLYRLFGVSFWIPVALGSVLGALSVRHVHRLASHVAPRSVAFAVAAGAALYGPSLYFDPLPLKTTLALYLALAALDAFLLLRAPALCGALLGLGALNGAQSVGLAAVFAISLARRRHWRSLAVLATTAALCGCPALVHNLVRGGDAVFSHVGGGMILWASNNPGANGRHKPPAYIRRNPSTEVPDYTAEASRALGLPVRPSEASAYFRDLAVAHWKSDPARALRLAVTKLGLLWNAYEYPDNYDYNVLAQLFPALSLPLPGWGVVVPIALLGFALALGPARRRAPGVRLIAAVLAVLAVPYLITYSNDRLRYSLLVALFPLAAFAMAELRAGPPARAVVLAMAAATIAFCVHLDTVRVPARDWGGFVAYELLGSRSRAEAKPVFALLALADPRDPGVLTNLGSLLQAEGDHERAAIFLARAAAIAPERPLGQFALGHSLRRTGRAAGAAAAYQRAFASLPGEPAIRLKLGLALFETGAVAEARAHLESALTALESPGGFELPAGPEERAEGHLALSRILAAAGDGTGAQRQMDRVHALMAR